MGEVRPTLDVQLRRYARSYRRRLRRFARLSPRCADLLYTFPGAAFALVTGYGTPGRRDDVVRLVKAGAPLAKVAKGLDVPLWLRVLPPAAFTEPLGYVPAIDGLDRKVKNHLPKDPEAAAMWLRWVLEGHDCGGDACALWVARQKIFRADVVDTGVAASLTTLGAFVWYAEAPNPKAANFMDRKWTPGVRFAPAVNWTWDWIDRVVFGYCLGEARQRRGWWRRQTVGPFTFVPLQSAAELTEEGDRMDNCVATYAAQVARGASLIYGVRRGKQHVATMEVVADRYQIDRPVIAQLLGPRNREVAADIRAAADHWLIRQGRWPVDAARGLAGVVVDEARWHKVWAPYWEAHGDKPVLPVKASAAALAGLRRELIGLGRVAELTA